jgi:hypothetical protein
MKKISKTLLIVFGSLLFICATCSKDEEQTDICEDTREPHIQKSFLISADVKYSDYVPFEGKIRMDIHKQYCNGTSSGEYFVEHNSGADGYWLSGMVYTYEFENSLDKVEVHLTIYKSDHTDRKEIHETFFYKDVLEYLNQVHKTYEVTLPWASEK